MLKPANFQNSSYDAQMKKVKLKIHDQTVFYWPFIRSQFGNGLFPIKSAHLGHDSSFGASLETRWYLSRLLGFKEPEGVEST